MLLTPAEPSPLETATHVLLIRARRLTYGWNERCQVTPAVDKDPRVCEDSGAAKPHPST